MKRSTLPPQIQSLVGAMQVQTPPTVARLMPRTREVHLLNDRGGYRVDLDRIPDAAALLGWIDHLAGKTWVTARHIRELMHIVERENGVRIDRAF